MEKCGHHYTQKLNVSKRTKTVMVSYLTYISPEVAKVAQRSYWGIRACLLWCFVMRFPPICFLRWTFRHDRRENKQTQWKWKEKNESSHKVCYKYVYDQIFANKVIWSPSQKYRLMSGIYQRHFVSLVRNGGVEWWFSSLLLSYSICGLIIND